MAKAQNQITVHSLIDQKTFIKFNKFDRFFTRPNAWNMLIFPGVATFLAIINWILGNPVFGWVLFGIGWFIPLFMYLLFYMNVLRQAEEFNLKEPKVFYTLEFTEKDIFVRNKKEKARYQWSQVYKAYRTRENIYLYFTELNAFLIPRGTVVDHSMDDLWDLLQKMLPAEKLSVKDLNL